MAEFGGNVASSLAKNPAFPDPPVSAADLRTQVDGFHSSVQAAFQGGVQLTAAKNTARTALIGALRKNANYVQAVANQDLEMLLTSGYFPNSTNRARTPLQKPVIAAVENIATTQLMLRLTSVANAKSYQVQVGPNGNGTWQDVGIFTQARRILVSNLTPGTTCNVRVRAIGGSTGYSDWSDPVARMSA